MNGLSVGDASFLYAETDKAPIHAATLQLFEVPAEKRGAFVHDLKRLMVERRYLVPYLTHRVRFVPGNIDHPVWVEDASFDVDHHVQSVDLGGEGTMHDLEDTVARLHEERMPLDRPLWRIVVIVGLEHGRAAYYSAVHHACVDGMGGQQALNVLTDTGPEPTRVSPEPRAPEREPSGANLVLRALGSLTKASFDQWTAIPRAMQTGSALMNRALDPKKSFGAYAMRAPRTSFNVEIDARRAIAVGRLPLGDVKATGKKFDCTVNDVFMAVAAGGLRRYLERRGELPKRPLIAGCPVSTRSREDKTQNNQVSMMLVSLETHVVDPLMRLTNIRESARIGKAVTDDLSASGAMDMRTFGLPNLITGAVRLAENAHLAARLPLPMNLVISNVPGPRRPLYSNGAEMIAMFPISIPVHGAGINLTVIGYQDSLDFSITAATCAMPEPRELRDDLLAAFFELAELVLDEKVSVEEGGEHRTDQAGDDPLAA